MKLDEKNYVELAEKAILSLEEKKDKRDRPVPVVTTSKIRNILAMTADIYNEVLNQSGEKLSEDIISRINYLKIRMLYEAGREPSVKNLVLEADLIGHVDEIKGSKRQFILFYRYLEALVAYRKFYIGGNDEN